MTDLIDDLQWRGLLRQHTDMDKLRDALNSGPVTFYCGFDPTAPSLHHGHLVQLILMRHLQNAGHKPIALVGGATGLIGDPRMSGERTLQPREVVAGWVGHLKEQISRFLDFEGDNPATMVNNLDWTVELSAIDLLRDLGKYFRMGTMLSKDAVARRLASKEGISYTEFSYQILQANDFLQLYRRYGCTLETGGDDQWGNLVGGMDLIHRVEGADVHVMTTPLITKADGTKFGKSEGGAVWLSADLLSPYAFYQFWINTDDADVIRFLKVFTFMQREEIERLEKAVEDEPYKREAQKALAAEVTKLVHGEDQLQKVLAATDALWGSGDLAGIDAATLSSATEHLPTGEIVLGESTIVDALVASGLEKGKRSARTTVSSGGAYLNNERVEDENKVLTEADTLADGTILIRKGRRNLAVVRGA
ncbi:MAG: tyrosine--tRNA ligase [Actinomycetaceae bacterium]|nr:tyrosine--tRNA ligase [Actinomycetaceae bacterium]